MATTTIPWGDGSGDNIYLDYPSASGDQTVTVTSDANTGSARTKTVTFLAGGLTETLTIIQEAGTRGGDWHYYITRGLTLLLDGIEKGEDNTAWVSRTGSVSFTNYGATFNSDHLYFDGTDDYLSNTSFSPTASNSGTIESVIDDENFGTKLSLVFMGKTNGGLGFGKTAAGLILLSCGSQKRARFVATKAKASYSIRTSYSYENGSLMSTNGSDYWGSRDSTNWIGRRSSGSYFKGKIYSLRMYSRLLIKSEMLRNLSVDNVRFSLGLQSYSPLEYIESDGSVRFVTYLYNPGGSGRGGTPPMSCEMKVLCKPFSTDQIICGCRQGTNERFYMLCITAGGRAYAGYRTDYDSAGYIDINDSLNNGTPFIVRTVISDGYQSLSIKQEGESSFTTVSGSEAGSIGTARLLSLFICNSSGTFEFPAASGTRLYYIKLYKDTTFTDCIYDGVPCSYFSEAGLWDLVTNTFNGRYDDTGSLTGGPVVQD